MDQIEFSFAPARRRPSKAWSFRDRQFARVLHRLQTRETHRRGSPFTYLSADPLEWESCLMWANRLTNRWVRRWGSHPEVIKAEAVFQLKRRRNR